MEVTNTHEEFRDSLGTLDGKGKRLWMYPKSVNGFFYKSRTYFSLFLLILLFSGPFIKINGQQIILLNVLERKFILFGLAFFPQDFYLFALTMITFMVFIILFTVVFGRAFCGWACPQTIFMEMIFRRIEYWIEGDANKQRKLNASPWNWERIWKKSLKQVIFFAISFLIANTFLAYIIGIEQLELLILDSPFNHLSSFIALLIFTTVFYAVFSYFRELVCIVVCPYGRLQSVLLDNNSIVVAYDLVRGEPRGKINKKETRTHGDCIDCTLCVQVCPTGIDIRNGTQLECINCTNCIDACDEVMIKIDKPVGLIRYASMNGIKNKTKLKLSTRIVAYSAVLVALMGLVSFFMLTKKDLEINILRSSGSMALEVNADTVANLYAAEIVNKTFEEVELELALEEGVPGIIKIIDGENHIVLKPQEVKKITFFIELKKEALTKGAMDVNVAVYVDNKIDEIVKTSFIGIILKNKSKN